MQGTSEQELLPGFRDVIFEHLGERWKGRRVNPREGLLYAKLNRHRLKHHPCIIQQEDG